MQSVVIRTEKDEFGEDVVITTSGLIQASTLVRRWYRYVSVAIIHEIICTGGIVPFRLRKTIFNNSSKEHYLNITYLSYDEILKPEFIDDDVVFIMQDVLHYELNGYYHTLPRVKSDIKQKKNILEEKDSLNLSPQQKASQAKQEKSLKQWLPAIKIMIAVAMKCQAEGPKARTRPELKRMCKVAGGELTAAQLDFLRGCLGKEHVNMVGGATVQN